MILLIQKHFDKLEEQRIKMLNEVRKLRPEQQIYRPEPESWCMLEVFDHLITAEGNGLKYMAKKIQGIDTIEKINFSSRVRSLLLKIALKLPIKFKAPAAARIQPREYYDFEEIEGEWNEMRLNYREFLDHFDKAASEKLLFRHPRAGMLNINQALDFQYEHGAHHQKQIERIKNHPGYPK